MPDILNVMNSFLFYIDQYNTHDLSKMIEVAEKNYKSKINFLQIFHYKEFTLI